jgi:hypothetical protein
MKSDDHIPFYAPDGAALGFRTIEAAQCLISCGFVKPSYGRKGHLRAIWLQQENGDSPVKANPPSGTRYSYMETLEHGRCWTLRRLDRRDDDGVLVSTRDAFFTVIADCMVTQPAVPVLRNIA